MSDKNRDLSEEEIDAVCRRFDFDRSRPIVTQISRFDYLKDPLGVIKAYQLVKDHVDCQLVLAGGGATDDPEGMQVLDEVRAEADKDPDIFVLFLPPASDLEINALQRASTVVLQKSLREGFGLTVSEALWKAKPVIAVRRRRHPAPDRPQVFGDPHPLHRRHGLLDQAAPERAGITPAGSARTAASTSGTISSSPGTSATTCSSSCRCPRKRISFFCEEAPGARPA